MDLKQLRFLIKTDVENEGSINEGVGKLKGGIKVHLVLSTVIF